MLTSEEIEILNYLKAFPRDFIPPKEISRRASTKKRFREEPNWVKPHLLRLLNRGLVEVNEVGHYRYLPAEAPPKRKKKRWVAPQIQKLLEQSGKSFTILEEGEGQEPSE